MSDEWSGGWVGNQYYGPDDAPPKRDDSIRAISWSLHTLKGKPTLKMYCRGEKTYAIGEVVSNDDFDMGDSSQRFRGIVRDVRVSVDAGQEISQYLEIELQQHDYISSGQYKPKTVLHGPPAAVSAMLKPDAEQRRSLLSKIAQYENLSVAGVIRKYGSWPTSQLVAFCLDIDAMVVSGVTPGLPSADPTLLDQAAMLAQATGCTAEEAYAKIIKLRQNAGLPATPKPKTWKDGKLFATPASPASNHEIPVLPKPGERKFHFDDE